MFRRRSTPSEATPVGPSFESSKRERDAIRARSGATSVLEILAKIACSRCGRAFETEILLGMVTGTHETGGRPADVEVLQMTCLACREGI